MRLWGFWASEFKAGRNLGSGFRAVGHDDLRFRGHPCDRFRVVTRVIIGVPPFTVLKNSLLTKSPGPLSSI